MQGFTQFLNTEPKKQDSVEEATIAGTPGWEKVKKNVTDKSGAVHTPMSRVRDLARQALKKQIEKKKEVKEMDGKISVTEEVEEDDTEEKHEMAQTQLHFIKYAAEEILEYIEMGGEIEEWYQNKLSKVQSEVESLHSYIEGESRRLGLKEQVQKADIPAYLRKQKGEAPLKLSDLKRKDTLSDKENLAKARNEAYDSPLDTPEQKKAREQLRKTLLDIKKKEPKHPAVQDVKEQAPVAPTYPSGYVVKYHDSKGQHKNTSKMFYNKNSANIHATKGNALDKTGGRYSVHPVTAKGQEVKEATALDKFRQASAEREKKHAEIEKEMKARHAAGKEDMKGAIDRLEKHVNKEETKIDEASEQARDNKIKARVHAAKLGSKFRRDNKIKKLGLGSNVDTAIGRKLMRGDSHDSVKAYASEETEIDEADSPLYRMPLSKSDAELAKKEYHLRHKVYLAKFQPQIGDDPKKARKDYFTKHKADMALSNFLKNLKKEEVEFRIDHRDTLKGDHKSTFAAHNAKVSDTTDKATYVKVPSDKADSFKSAMKSKHGTRVELAEARGQADKYWNSAEHHKAEAQKHKVGSEAYHMHMSKHYDAKSQYHDALGQHSSAEKAGDRSEEHHMKAQQASNK